MEVRYREKEGRLGRRKEMRVGEKWRVQEGKRSKGDGKEV